MKCFNTYMHEGIGIYFYFIKGNSYPNLWIWKILTSMLVAFFWQNSRSICIYSHEFFDASKKTFLKPCWNIRDCYRTWLAHVLPVKSKITHKSNDININLAPRAHLQHFRQRQHHHIHIRCWIVISLWEDVSKYGCLPEKQQLLEFYSFLLIVETNLFFATNVPTDSSKERERERERESLFSHNNKTTAAIQLLHHQWVARKVHIHQCWSPIVANLVQTIQCKINNKHPTKNVQYSSHDTKSQM